MSCPFALFQRPTPPASGVDGKTLSSGPLSALLSQHLRKGTAAAHAAIERSPGVKLLLASVSSESKALVKRLDYVRWLIILHALYSSLETVLFTLASASGQQDAQKADPISITLLNPLLQANDGELLQNLARSPALVSDIKVHAALTEEEEGASLTDVADALELEQDAHTDSSNGDALTLLMPQLWSLQSHVQSGVTSDWTTQEIWLSILTPAQKEATGGYVARIVALALRAGVNIGVSEAEVAKFAAYPPPEGEPFGGPAGAGALLTHAYTRYLGDLSGGQFIAKHVRTKWPTEAEDGPADGLRFYAFLDQPNALGPRLVDDPVTLWKTDAAAKSRAERALKDAFRTASDVGLEYTTIISSKTSRYELIQSLVDEASLGFLLNGALFDSLAGVDPDQAGPGSAADAIARANAQPPPQTDVRGESVLSAGHPPVKVAGLLALVSSPPSWLLALYSVALALVAFSLHAGQVGSAPSIEKSNASTASP